MRDSQGNTLLHVVCDRADLALVLALVNMYDIDTCINAQNQKQQTALHIAAAKGSTSLIKVLTSHKSCDPTIVDRDMAHAPGGSAEVCG